MASLTLRTQVADCELTVEDACPVVSFSKVLRKAERKNGAQEQMCSVLMLLSDHESRVLDTKTALDGCLRV